MEEVQAAMRQAGTEARDQSHLAQLGRLSAGCLGVAAIAMATARYL
jgi:hypothetical protein